MAPAGRSPEWRARGPAAREQGAPRVGPQSPRGKRRAWRPRHQQAFPGSVREGQGFAFRRKLKIQQNYKKLQWKVKKAPTSQEPQFTDHYPDHLKHLYLAEEERLRKQRRKVGQPPSEEQVDQPVPEEECNTEQTLSEEQSSDYQPQPEQLCTLNSVTVPKKKKTSNQKAQEEYERIQAKRAAKKFEFETRKREREEAQRLYKKKKMEAFKVLSKKTRKGQPNLNLQMEYLLQKIQGTS
ncbi:thyroid transcription factor 1-associated protein 26 [Phodopus roborovskii]|uniref:Ccdc59 protein n=1 Tax=Phodopus roborovskii TaxID=109678 RepID=A0AAV0A6B6_PHORO|nr:thyroid transcription factor 1-associated protein 26 [Phodopus roborovskii]CAH7331751.1 Ccdc59 [Phodopus roborovskii]